MPIEANTGSSTTRTIARRAAVSGAALLAICGAAAAASNNVALLVRMDLVPNGVIDFQDLNAYLSFAGKGDPRADVNGDGVVDANDLTTLASKMGTRFVPPATPPEPTPPRNPSTSPVVMPSTGGGKPESQPPAQTPTGAYAASYQNGALRFAQGAYEIMNTTTPVWRPVSGGASAQVAMAPQDNGFDLVLRMDNTTRRAQKLGAIVLDGFRLGQAIRVRDFRTAGADIALSDAGAAPIRSGLSYPSEWYSPVMVLQSDVYTLGVSLQYPILDYKHEARLSVQESNGSQRVVIELNDDEGVVPRSRQGDLAAREQREYVVSVRVLPASEPEWISVLEPYREYFTEMYGDAEYDRDPRPVQAVVMATASAQSVDNRAGYLFRELRPDLNGFGPWVEELEARAHLGWQRFMLWRPTGLPSNSRGVNTGCGKFAFASELEQGNLADAFDHLPRFDTRGRELGMWWGDPLQTVGRRTGHGFHPSDNADVAAALREAQTAAGAGAETIGLDSFNKLPAWEAYGWLNTLRAATPGVKYVTEPACGDLIHTIAGTLLLSQPDASNPSAALSTRFYLADYLLPGHETWGMIRVDRMGGPNDDAIREEIYRLAEHGYVPVVVPPVDVDRRIVAQETWRDPEW